MNGKDGKPFKTRDGGVMRLENLIREINEEMYKKLLITAPYQKKRRERQHRSLDFLQLSTEILSNQASKDYVFDVDRLLPLRGIQDHISFIRS